MKGFVQDIEGLAVKNTDFRRVLYTAKHCQLVVMALKPKEEIGAEVHKLDQFFRVEEGPVRLFSTAFERPSEPASRSSSPPVPNIISSIPAVSHLNSIRLYAPPNHRDGIIHHTRGDAETNSEHFDGKTTE
jgi:hypothetical protein